MSMNSNRNKTLYANSEFQKQIQATVKQIEKLPSLRKNIYEQIQEWTQERERQGAE